MTARAASALFGVFFVALVCLGVTLTAARAVAVFQEVSETGRPGYLVLSVDSETPLWADLAPGDSMRWLVEAALREATSGTLSVQLHSSGRLPESSGMTAQISACSGVFDLDEHEPHCLGVLETVLPVTPVLDLSQDGQRYPLADLHSGDPRQLLVTFTIPEGADPHTIDGQSVRMGLGVHASGENPEPVDPVTPTPPDGLAITGADVLPLGTLAAGLIGLGVVLARRGHPIHAVKDGRA